MSIHRTMPWTWSASSFGDRWARGPQHYLETLLRDLETSFAPIIDRALTDVLAVRFSSEEFNDRHRRHTRRQLVERHSLPFGLAMVDHHITSDDVAVDYLVTALLAHTSVLTHLDAHTDQAHLGDATREVLLDAGYSLASLYEAARQASALPHGTLLISECFPLSATVTGRMFQDVSERWADLPAKCDIDRVVEDYLMSPGSRLLGSGYLEVFSRAALASIGERMSARETVAFGSLRRLRQLTDEAIDLEEDLRAGLVTLPLLLLLRERYDETIERCGKTTHEMATNLDAVVELLRSSDVPAFLYREALRLHDEGIAFLGRGPQSASTTLFHVRVAYLESLMPSSWMARALTEPHR